MTIDERFFYENAGYSYDYKRETPEEGKLRCAIQLAEAEAYARNAGWFVTWHEDEQLAQFQDDDGNWHEQPAVYALLRDADDSRSLASLGGIAEDGDPATRNKYRRVIAAELASEALADDLGTALARL